MATMLYCEAVINDIPQMQFVRHPVKENVLSNPALVASEDCAAYITIRGKGWVCEVDNSIIGFSIADLRDNNICPLFVKPEYAKAKELVKRFIISCSTGILTRLQQRFG